MVTPLQRRKHKGARKVCDALLLHRKHSLIRALQVQKRGKANQQHGRKKQMSIPVSRYSKLHASLFPVTLAQIGA